MRDPVNKKELQMILGYVNFMRQFIPNLSELTTPLRELLKNKVEFHWLQQHTDALNVIKEKIVNAPVLANFDARKEVTIQGDASQNGLGCCLMQEGRPVSYASRSLSDSERNYSQIEKELLAIVFATGRFHNYIYGRDKITVITDHKPLINLLNKKICDIPSSRLRRMRIKLLDYQLSTQYLSGKLLHVADLLSRMYLDECDSDDGWITEVVHSISNSLDITEEKRREFKVATLADPVLSKLSYYYFNGWPKFKNYVDENVKFYFKLRDQIFVEDDLVFLNYRLIVPCELRQYILKLLHESHFGIVKTKQRARSTVYWPGLMSDIEDMVSKCTVCERFQNLNCKEPMIKHEIPEIPFNKIACDILEFENRSFLIVQDYFSKWLEIIPL